MRNKPQNNGLDYFHSVGTETTKKKGCGENVTRIQSAKQFK